MTSSPRGVSAGTDPPAPDPRPSVLTNDFNREMRFAVVMYGGVSLAVYINGAAQELFEMVRATAPREGNPLAGAFRFAPEALTGSARVYRELGHALGARFVVDILSGTSAGGINAIYLAKALVENKSLRDLRDLWINDGDLTKLLNDQQSLLGPDAVLLEDPPQSVLNGQLFYRKLLDALDRMDSDDKTLRLPDPQPAGEGQHPYVDELDLLITATDFDGANLPLNLFDKVVLEPRYRKSFRFRYKTADDENGSARNDLDGPTNPMLAFAARCTASFPVAFPPFRLLDIYPMLKGRLEAAGKTRTDVEEWKKKFFDNDDNFAGRYFVDGGYLDNKPFEGAIEAAGERRRPLLPVERKLLYLEPHPVEVPFKKVREKPPDVVANVQAVLGLPRVETIRAQIEEIQRRNRVIQRATTMTDGADQDIQKNERKVRQGDANLWALDDLRHMFDEYGVAYGGYHRLKVSRLTNWLAHCVDGDATGGQAQTASKDARRLISVWREGTYSLYYSDDDRKTWDELREKPGDKSATDDDPRVVRRNNLTKAAEPHVALGVPATQNRLLVDFDLFYRLRRIEFERGKVREAMESPEKARVVLTLGRQTAEIEAAVASWSNEQGALAELQRRLQGLHQKLLETLAPAASGLDTAVLTRLITRLKRLPESGNPDPAVVAQTPDGKEIVAATDIALRPLRSLLRDRFIAAGKDYENVLAPSSSDGPLLKSVRAALGSIHNNYAEMDLVRFSVLETMGTGELEPIDVIRVSAADTYLAGKRGVSKLAGVTLAHFGAFFDADWRRHDILWGRLDTAERIITTLAPRDTPRETVDRWLVAAFTGIIREELGPRVANPERVEALAKELAAKIGSPHERKQAAEEAMAAAYDADWAQVEVTQPAAEAKAKIAGYLEKHVVNEPVSLPRKLTLLNRTTVIVRHLVDGLAEGRRQKDNVLVKGLLLILRVLVLVVEVAQPGLKSTLVRRVCGVFIAAGILSATINGLLGRWVDVAIYAGVVGVGIGLFHGAKALPRFLERLGAKQAATPAPERREAEPVAAPPAAPN